MPEPGAERTEAEALGYAEAMAELDEILREIDRDDVDLDHLADRMRRAAALIERCRARLADARVEVERVAADLTAVEVPDPPDPAPEPDADGGAPDG